MDETDVIVVGAGVVGLAIARALEEAGREVVVLEAEAAIGTGLSSRNSEVIHAGLYYQKDSLKAVLCRQGRDLLYAYCTERAVGHRRCGKLLVGADDADGEKLRDIKRGAEANGLDDLRWVSAGELAEMEPQVSAQVGLLSPSTGIVDAHQFLLALLGDIEDRGGVVSLKTPFLAARVERGGFVVETGGDMPFRLRARLLVNTAALAAQSVARAIDGLDPVHIPPLFLAKGHYYSCAGAAPFHRLIYPVPEKGGLGVHATLDLGGQVRFGPDVDWVDSIDFRFDDSRRERFCTAIRRYFPGLQPDRLSPGYTGIRPKLAGPDDTGFTDFRIDGEKRHGIPGLINLFGIESPGLTASLAIGRHVARMIEN